MLPGWRGRVAGASGSGCMEAARDVEKSCMAIRYYHGPCSGRGHIGRSVWFQSRTDLGRLCHARLSLVDRVALDWARLCLVGRPVICVEFLLSYADREGDV